MRATALFMVMLVSGIALAQEAGTAKPPGGMSPAARQMAYDALKSDFLNLPLAKRLTTPLLWLHGEDHQILREHVDRIKDGATAVS